MSRSSTEVNSNPVADKTASDHERVKSVASSGGLMGKSGTFPACVIFGVWLQRGCLSVATKETAEEYDVDTKSNKVWGMTTGGMVRVYGMFIAHRQSPPGIKSPYCSSLLIFFDNNSFFIFLLDEAFVQRRRADPVIPCIFNLGVMLTAVIWLPISLSPSQTKPSGEHQSPPLTES